MGNAIERRRGVRWEDDGVFPIGSFFGDINRILTPPSRLPSCLDELIDWSSAASIMVSYLQENDRGSPLCRRGGSKRKNDDDGLRFVPRGILRGDNMTTTTNKTMELPGRWLDKAEFLAQQVVMVVESRDTGTSLCYFTGFQFCQYYALLCELTELMTLDVEARTRDTKSSSSSSSLSPHECNICQSHMEAIVCPCSQGVCNKCQETWVQRNLNCPFCRTRFANQKDLNQMQWQLTEWNHKSVEKDIAQLLLEERDFWITIPRLFTESDEALKTNWLPLRRSSRNTKEENDLVLL